MSTKKNFNKYFSKFDRITSLCEAVIHVDKYINILKDIINQNRDIIYNQDVEEDKLKILNHIFKPYKISFYLEDSFSKNYGLIKGVCNKENIKIIVGFNIYDYLIDSPIFVTFTQKLLTIIGHELVHRGQYYIRKADFIHFYAYEQNQEKNYYSHPQEIMAYAWMGIENMRSHGYSDKQILSKVKSNNISSAEIGFSHIYISELKELDVKAYKRFIKYMYKYLKDPIKYDLKITC